MTHMHKMQMKRKQKKESTITNKKNRIIYSIMKKDAFLLCIACMYES